MREAVASFYQATKAAERERDELAGVIGSVRGQRQQMQWLVITAAAALILGLLIAPFAARALPFGWNGGVAATRSDRCEAEEAWKSWPLSTATPCRLQ